MMRDREKLQIKSKEFVFETLGISASTVVCSTVRRWDRWQSSFSGMFVCVSQKLLGLWSVRVVIEEVKSTRQQKSKRVWGKYHVRCELFALPAKPWSANPLISESQASLASLLASDTLKGALSRGVLVTWLSPFVLFAEKVVQCHSSSTFESPFS